MSRERALAAVFLAAGAPALVYQVVWQRALTLWFGVDIYSTSVTVATFMLGLGLGSLAGGRLADGLRRPVLLYAWCELLLGLFGLGSLRLFRLVGERLGGSPVSVLIPLDFALMLVPTLLMGMTLPLMCRSLRVDESLVGRRFSALYGLNTLGAALGALVTSYLLLGTLGLEGTVAVAAAANLVLAAVVAALAPGRLPETPPRPAPSPGPAALAERRRVLACALLSGLGALGYELVAYRLLVSLLHGTVYVFGTLLFVFLLGNAGGAWLARRGSDRAGGLGRFARAQLGIALYLGAAFGVLGHLSGLPGLRHLVAATALTTFHPSPELASGELGLRALYSLADIALWSLFLLAVPSLLMGYGFPQLVRAATPAVARFGRSIGAVYFANILGATAGSLLFGLVVLDALGSEWALRLVAVLACAAAWLARPAGRRAAVLAIAAAVLLALPGPPRLLRAIHYADHPSVGLTLREDRSGVVALRRQDAIITFAEEAALVGRERLLIDGAPHGELGAGGETPVLDPAVRLALSAHPAPRRVLSIGLGDGKMCAAALAWPGVEEVVVVELSSALAEVLGTTAQGRAVLRSPKLRLVHDDGRRWLLAHPEERFDLILNWPLHAAQAGSGNLFSLEFLGRLAAHLEDGGLLYLRSADMFATARTLATLFPHVVRLGQARYVASERPFRFRPAAAGWPGRPVASWIAADRELILERTAGSGINRDFAPRAELFLTYRHAGVLRTWGGARGAYGLEDPARFARWVAP